MSVEAELYPLAARSPIGMYRSTDDGRLVYVNPALARLLGHSVEQLLEVTLDELYVEPRDRLRLLEPGVETVQTRWKKRDGSVLPVQIWPHRDDNGIHDASVIDISAADRQRETNTILDLVLHQTPAIYWVVDRDLRIVRTGGAVQRVLGYPPETFIGVTLHAVHKHEPGSVDPIGYHQRAVDGETLSYDTEYRGKQFAVTVAPYRTSDGTVGAIGTSLDVTASRRLERRMVDAQRAESLGVLAGGLAHDFNNLLVAVIGNADLALREIPAGTPGRPAIDNIRDAGLRAAELTDQLLTYAGRGGVGTTRVKLAGLVDELLRIVATSMPAEIKFDIDIPNGLQLLGDPAQVRQVLLNLINNARDSIGRRGGAITVQSRLVQCTGVAEPDDVLTPSTGTYVMLEVTDDGPGMDNETLRHVFEPFFTTKHTGHGLGLAAVLGIVRAHHGGIRVITSLGTGARFQILWPAADPAAPREASPSRIATRTVLVIDDEDLVRDVVARMIEDLGYAAVTAPDGATALELLERQTVDAVLVDLTMPRMSGADVIDQLRQRRPGLPVVLCSGFDRDSRGPVKADAYLPKPFRIDALERMLAKVLG